MAKKNELAPMGLMDQMFEMEGAGATFDSTEMTTPFIRMAQAMSDEVKKTHAKFIPGLGAGDIFNNLTHEIWEDGVEVIPCYTNTTYPVFIPEDQGGGFVEELSATDPVLQQTTREGSHEYTPDGNEVIKTDNFMCMVRGNQGMWSPAILDMKKTSLKTSRRWKSQISIQTVKHPKTGQVAKAPLFANIWKLTTVEETNKQGKSYFVYSVTKVGMVEDPQLFEEVKSLYIASHKGDVKIAAPEQKQKLEEQPFS